MIQKLEDFVKPKGSKMVLADNFDYYDEIKKQREYDRQMTALNSRIDRLERELNTLKELLRTKFCG